MASKRVSEQFEVGARRRAMAAQARTAKTRAKAAIARRVFKPRDLRRALFRGTGLRWMRRVTAKTLQLPMYRRLEGWSGGTGRHSAQVGRRIPGGEDKIFQ